MKTSRDFYRDFLCHWSDRALTLSADNYGYDLKNKFLNLNRHEEKCKRRQQSNVQQ